jgi:hypothetical protein
MHVTGPNGESGGVIGIVDSGADRTSMPFGYASLMGYTAATLKSQTIQHAAGTAMSHRALEPAVMYVPEIPDVKIEFHPVFVEGMQMVLLGRTDFMAAFDVTLMESQQLFSLTPH